MSNKTRKRIWPASLVLAVAMIGVLAAFVVLAAAPQGTSADGGAPHSCAGMTAAEIAIHNALDDQLNGGNGQCLAAGATPTMTTPTTPTMPPVTGDGSPCDDFDTDTMAATSCVTSSSTSASATVELKLVIESLDPPGDVAPGDDDTLAVGGSIVLYLEDDFAEPDDISASDVYFVSNPVEEVTGNGARVYATVDPVISNSDYFTADKDDIAIQIFVPDMCRNATTDCEGDNGLIAGDTISVVVTKGAGLKNASEEGTHSTGFTVLASDHTGSVPGMGDFTGTNTVGTLAKIGLSDVDNSRGYEMTVTGSGFNNGTTAGAYVLHIAGSDGGHRNAYIWNALNCEEMDDAVGPEAVAVAGADYCAMYAGLGDPEKAVVGDLDFSKGDAEAALCSAIIRSGTNAGSALVGSDDKVAVTFEVTVPTFGPGNTNHICMVDGEGRTSKTDVEDFNLQPSIAVVPSTASTGDTVNVFAQDYQNVGQGFSLLKIGGQTEAPNGAALSSFITDREPISVSGSGSITFEVPGGLEGTLRVDAMWGDTTGGGADMLMPNGKCDDGEACVSEDSKITLGGAELNSSKTDVLPNETITINGNGFGSQTCIPEANITLDNVAMMVHDDSVSECTDDKGTSERSDDETFSRAVEVSNSGQFVATVILWPDQRNAITNPSLIPGTHTLDVTDSQEYGSSINLTIPEPSISVTPDIAGPRDYITVTGENWAVDNLDNTLSDPITVVIEDYRDGRTYPVYADSVGRFTVEHRVHRRVAIPDTVQVKANYDEGRVVQIGSFAIPASTITVTPGEGQPGDMVTLTAANMPVYTEADYVEIGGTTYTDPGVNTDRDGNITVEDVLIPGLDPGVYSVVINVDDTIAIGEVNVLAESSAAGAPAELPGAVESLSDNLVAIFHFDDVGKSWSFYDPRPEFADLNTLTEMVNGEAYWILVSETVDDVVLNNKARSLTCRGADCWNLEVW